MSKLDDLIKKLCPNGVEFHSVEDVANVARGVRVVRSQLADQGSYPVFQNSLTPMGYYESKIAKLIQHLLSQPELPGKLDTVILIFGRPMIAISLSVQRLFPAAICIICFYGNSHF